LITEAPQNWDAIQTRDPHSEVQAPKAKFDGAFPAHSWKITMQIEYGCFIMQG